MASIVQLNFDGYPQHVGAPVDGRQAGEALGQLAQSVQTVQVGRGRLLLVLVAVLGETGVVQLSPFHCFDEGSLSVPANKHFARLENERCSIF